MGQQNVKEWKGESESTWRISIKVEKNSEKKGVKSVRKKGHEGFKWEWDEK